MKKILLVLALVPLLAAAARAQDAAPAAAADDAGGEESAFHVTPRDKYLWGNQNYRSNDASLSLDLPYDLGLNADYGFYRSDNSSFTQTFSVGASADWRMLAFSLTYSWNPLQNDSANRSIDGKIAAHTDSKDFRTTVGVEGSVTDNFQYLRFPNKTAKVEVTQKMGALSLKQRLFHDTTLGAEVDDYWYNRDIQQYSLGLAQLEALLNRTHPRFFNGISGALNGASGLLSGFPSWGVRLSASQNVSALPVPVTLWATYDDTHYADAFVFNPPTPPKNSLVTGVTSDSQTYGVDAEIVDDLTATLQYNHVRQTGQTVQDLYGASLEKRF